MNIRNLAVALLCGAFLGSADGRMNGEYEIKAAFVVSFPKYVEYPGSFDQIVVGILGDDPFGQQIDAVASSKSIGGHPFVVRRLRNESEAKGCQVVFVSSSENEQGKRIASDLRGSPVLTVADFAGAAQKGLMIGLFLEQNKVHFDINNSSAKASHLTLSANLLKLARQVY